MPMIPENSWWLQYFCHICPTFVLRNLISIVLYMCYTPMNLGLSGQYFHLALPCLLSGAEHRVESLVVHFQLDFYSHTGALDFLWAVLQQEFYRLCAQYALANEYIILMKVYWVDYLFSFFVHWFISTLKCPKYFWLSFVHIFLLMIFNKLITSIFCFISLCFLL